MMYGIECFRAFFRLKLVFYDAQNFRWLLKKFVRGIGNPTA